MTKLDKAHAMAEKLTPESSRLDVLAVLDAYREAWGMEHDPAPGTIAWFLIVFLPRWLD